MRVALADLMRGAATMVAAAVATPSWAQETFTGRLSYHWAPAHMSAKFSQKFAEEVTARSNGRVTIETFPAGQLYTIRQIVGALSAGGVEFGGVVTHNQFPALDPDYNVFQFPNFWESIEQQRDFLLNDPVGNRMWRGILDRAGLVQVVYVPVGPLVTWSATSPMATAESMRGLKARALVASERAGFEARGMDVVSLSTEEIYTALQNGMVDVVSTVPTAAEAYSWWDYLKFVQLPYPLYGDSSIMANKRWFDSLPEDMQQLVLEVGAEISAEATSAIITASEESLDRFVAQGGQVTELEGEALAEFRDLDRQKTEPVLEELISPEVMSAARAFVGRAE